MEVGAHHCWVAWGKRRRRPSRPRRPHHHVWWWRRPSMHGEPWGRTHGPGRRGHALRMLVWMWRSYEGKERSGGE